jgi:hypothetical protein
VVEAWWRLIDVVLYQGCIEHRKCDKAKADGDASDRLQIYASFCQQRVEDVFYKWTDEYASHLVHAREDVVWRVSGVHVAGLRYKVVLHLIEADVKNNKCQTRL